MRIPLKPYKYIFMLIAALLSFCLLSCGSHMPEGNNRIKKAKTQICMDLSSPDRILTKLKNHADAPAGEKLYLLFHGSVCPTCPELRKKIDKLNLDSEILYMNIDFTWIFILSRHLQLTGVPTLVVFIQGTPKFAKEGGQSILEYLHANSKEG